MAQNEPKPIEPTNDSLGAKIGQDLKRRVLRLPGQLVGRNPFSGTIEVERLPTFKSIFYTVRNIWEPLSIIDNAFKNGSDLSYLDIPGFGPILYLREPELMKEILAQTGQNREFERDGLETGGIGRIVGEENLLRSEGEDWKRHKKALAKPLSMNVVGSPKVYEEMERIGSTQLGWLEGTVREAGGVLTKELEPEIKTAMLEILSATMFGVELPSEMYRNRYLPALENVIQYILRDTVNNPFAVKRLEFPSITKRRKALKANNRLFEELVDNAIEQREIGGGFWDQLQVQGTDMSVRSNVKVLIAGALEATASYISWTLSCLSRNQEAQEKVRQEALAAGGINAEGRKASPYLQMCLDESLRLHAPLYLLPRTSKDEVTVTTSKGTLTIPENVHIILATYHAGRHETYWGVERTGYPATDYVPERWDPENMKKHGMTADDNLHFGFGHGPRACSGKNFAQVEAFVAMNLFMTRFKITGVNERVEAASGISTRPADKVLVKIECVEN